MPSLPTPRFDQFYRHDALTRLLLDYAEARPGLVAVHSIGKSHDGRDIWVATVTNVATGVSRETATSANGFYRVLDLGPGQYRVAASKAGFQNAEQSDDHFR